MHREIIERLGKLVEERENTEGAKIFRMMLNLATSQYAVNRNYHELVSAITSYEGNLEIWNVKNRGMLDAFLRELSRLLHNYLSSTFTVIQHNVRLCKDLHCPELYSEYLKMVESLKINECISFVKDLRTFAQHIGLPILSAQMSFSKSEGKGSELKQKILLEKDVLLSWKEWKHSSRRYIQSHKEIDLKLVLSEYQDLITKFNRWFYKRVGEIFSKQLKEFAQIDFEIGKLRREAGM